MKAKNITFKRTVVTALISAACVFTSVAQTKTVWVMDAGTYDVSTQEKVEDLPVVTTCSKFSSNDYSAAVEAFTGVSSRVFKLGGGVFSAPEGYSIVEVSFYGWPRRTGSSSITDITVDDKVIATFDDENPTPYIFADCGADVNSENRTKENCTIMKLAEITQSAPAKSFKVDIKGETHAFCKLVLMATDATGIGSIRIDETSGDGIYYDLNGCRVMHPSKGIYICKGKKVYVNN